MSSLDTNPNKKNMLQDVRIETGCLDDLPDLVGLVADLMELQSDFYPDLESNERGLFLVLENPHRGRIFVLRNDDQIIGMVNLLFTISTAVGGFVILLEDFIIHPDHRGQGYGTMLLDYVLNFAKKKNFKRITLLTDKLGTASQNFFKKEGFEGANMVPMRKIIGD